jgi:hypothetical protein
VHYRGAWSIVSCPRIACSPNRVEHRSATAGNRARFAFTGTQVTWIATKGPLGGTAGVYLDGVSQGRVHLYRRHVRDRVYVYTSPTLSSGTHTLRIQVTHNQRVNIDAFIVQP